MQSGVEVVKTEGKPEPLANLIIATVGTYRSNILNDLKVLFATDSIPRQLFLDLYSNMPSPFNTALAGLLDQSNLTQADIKSVFQGYEIHHVIPANFLWENDTIAKLFSQDSIQFGYNDFDEVSSILNWDNAIKTRWISSLQNMIRQLLERRGIEGVNDISRAHLPNLQQKKKLLKPNIYAI